MEKDAFPVSRKLMVYNGTIRVLIRPVGEKIRSDSRIGEPLFKKLRGFLLFLFSPLPPEGASVHPG